MQNSKLSELQKSKMLLWSFICIGIGLVGGLAWVVVLAGYLQLWPVPALEFSLPETKELWRNAHIGPIMNGMLLIALTAVSHLLTLSKRQVSILFYTSIIMVVFNTIGYQLSPFTSQRGLAPVGEGLNQLCYFSFYIAALCAFAVVIIGIIGSYSSIKSSKAN